MTDQDPPVLSVHDLSVRYGRLVALRNASLDVRRGEVVSIIGPNGAGKSTLLAAIAGGQPTFGGEIFLDGKPVTSRRPEDLARDGVSLVPEGRHVFSGLSVLENLKIGAFMRGRPRVAARDLERVLDYFPRLRERLSFPAGRLSGGEQQMLVIARALMTRPRLMMIDEPSLGLAPKIVDQIYDIVLEMRKSEMLTLLINEQSSKRILKHSDRIYVLRSGTIQLEGRAADLQDGHAINAAYFGFAEEKHD